LSLIKQKLTEKEALRAAFTKICESKSIELNNFSR